MAPPGKLPATAYVVLGLVSIRPGAGHELAGFSERSIGNFFPIARSQVYSELERLCRLGLLSVTEVPQRRFPTKRVYEVTEEGEAELRRWLDEAVVEPERNRNLFLVRVFFGDRVSHERLDVLLDEYEAKARARRGAMEAIAERLADRHSRSSHERPLCMGCATRRRLWTGLPTSGRSSSKQRAVLSRGRHPVAGRR